VVTHGLLIPHQPTADLAHGSREVGIAETTPESTDATLSALRRAGLDEDRVGSVAKGFRRGDKLEALLLV